MNILFHSFLHLNDGLNPCENVHDYEVFLYDGTCYSFQLIGGTIHWILNGSLLAVTVAGISGGRFVLCALNFSQSPSFTAVLGTLPTSFDSYSTKR